jgi:hypothetical protein
MISIELTVDQNEIESAMIDMHDDDLIDMIVSVVERSGSSELTKTLIGKLGDTYTYLEETLGDGAE